MLGLLVQLALSWLLVWLYERNDLRVLGLRPDAQRMLDSGRCFVLTALCCAAGFGLKTAFGGMRWQLNPAFGADLLLEGF